MTSNFKPKPSAKEAPNEPFKRAVTGCLRAIARKPEIEVSFAAERPGIAGTKARLPEPPRKLSGDDASIVRGHADAIALRMACHDKAVHRKLMPGGQQARAVFEAVEQARVEAIGARRMVGVARNLNSMLDDRFHRGRYDQITDRADAPIEDAIAMIVRERLTGAPPPAAARKIVDLWQPFIEQRAGRDLDRLGKLIDDQRRFGDVVHDLLDALDMGDDRSSAEDEEESESGSDEERDEQQGKDGQSAESEDAERMTVEQAEASPDQLPETATETLDAPSAEMPDEFGNRQLRDGVRALAPASPAERAARPAVPAVHREIRRDHGRGGIMRGGRARAFAGLSR